MAVIGFTGAMVKGVVWVLYRIRVLRPLRAIARGFDYRRLPVVDLAFLAGGSTRALLTGLALSQSAPPGQTAPEPIVERLRFVGVNILDAPGAVDECRDELVAIRRRLESAGLVVRKDSGRVLKSAEFLVAAVVFVAILALGIVAWRGGASFRDAMAGAFILFFFTHWLPGLICAPGRKARAVSYPLVKAARRDFSYLQAKRRPDYTSLGPWALPLATALFGHGALAGSPEISSTALYSDLSSPRRHYNDSLDYGTLGRKNSGDGGDVGSGDGAWD